MCVKIRVLTLWNKLLISCCVCVFVFRYKHLITATTQSVEEAIHFHLVLVYFHLEKSSLKSFTWRIFYMRYDGRI